MRTEMDVKNQTRGELNKIRLILAGAFTVNLGRVPPLLSGALIVLVDGPALAPFIYTIF